MASHLKQIFLVALFLTIALGCDGGKTCRKTEDCPPCRAGRKFCVAGQCTCAAVNTNTNTMRERRQLQEHAVPCKGNADCAKHCHLGPERATCESGFCFCACT